MALTSCWFTSGQEFSKDSLYLKKIFANQSNWDSILHYANKLEISKNACFIYEGKIHKSKYYYKKGEYQKSEKKVRTILKELQNKDDFNFFFRFVIFSFFVIIFGFVNFSFINETGIF